MDNRTFLTARALVLADLEAARRADPQTVSLLEDAVSARQWWAEQWPEGAIYVAGLVAQAQPGDVVALMCHAERQAVYDWIAGHGGTSDSPETLAAKVRAASVGIPG